jgi:hypothetical protein
MTSWADLDLYVLNFGAALGQPDLIRLPYAEADGVDIAMPRWRVDDEAPEVTIMLCKDDIDGLWDSPWA